MSRRYRALSLLLILSISACSDGSGPRDNQRGLVATAISAGGAATCAITPTHSLVCWGWINGSGEPPVTPSVLGQDLVRAVSMSRGWEHFCLVTLELKARCWGEMLLNATYFTELPRPYLTIAPELDFVAIAPGASHACATRVDATTMCWGSYNGGVRGTGEPAIEWTDHDAPNVVAGGLTFIQVVSGNGASCGLTAEGRAYCWGLSLLLGSPGAQLASPEECLSLYYPQNQCVLAPVPVDGDLQLAELSASANQTCGRTAGGQVYCWAAEAPSEVVLPVAATALSVGNFHSCILDATGQAYCWGSNRYGGLGRLPLSEAVLDPAPVATELRFSRISAGGEHTCGLEDGSGTVYCWGYQQWFLLGAESEAAAATPVPAPAPG